MTEAELKEGLARYIETIGGFPRSDIGHKGPVTPLRLGIYLEGEDPQTGRIYVADPAEVALGRLAWRDWITVRGGKAGGSQAVQPGGGNPLGGFGVGGLLTLLTGVPIGTVLGSAPPPDLNDEKAAQALINYLQKKSARR